MDTSVVALIVPPGRPPYEWNGFLKSARALDTRALVVAGYPEETYPRDTTVQAMRCTRLPMLGRRAGPAALLKPEDIEEHLRDVDAMVCVEVFSSLTYYAVRAAKRLGKPSVVVCWETLPGNPVFRLPPYSHFSRAVADKCDLIVATTVRAAQAHQYIGIPPGKITQIYPGLDQEVPANRPDLTSSQFIDVLYLGNLYRWKGLEDLVSAFIELQDISDVFRLTIAGAGPLLYYLRRIAIVNPRIRLLGKVTQSDAHLLRQTCDVFVYPSRIKTTAGLPRWEEQFGFGVVEAMVAGMPCVVSDCGALPEVVANTALIVPQRDPRALADALGSLVDKDKRAKMGIKARARAGAIFDEHKQARRFEEAIEHVLSSTDPHPKP